MPEAKCLSKTSLREASSGELDMILALFNWTKYNNDWADETVYQANKMATAIEDYLEERGLKP